MSLKTFVYLLPQMRNLVAASLSMRNQVILSTRDHLKLCVDWLLSMQKASGTGGYAASYSLVTGLTHPYIETTGYIVPTMFDLAVALDDRRCHESALRAGEWLLTMQLSTGAFADHDGVNPQVFDTGQVMLGLNRLYCETKDHRYLEVLRRAADWLVSSQDADGSWTSLAYHRGLPATYHTRVAAALLQTAELTGDIHYVSSAEKNLQWAAGLQQSNGFFLNSELKPGADPVLHTMVYVLEGFLLAYQLTGARRWLDVLLRGAEPLLRVNLNRDLVPRSQYNGNFETTNPEKCVPGLAQWAFVCLHLYEVTRRTDWLHAAQLSIYYLKSKQLRGKSVLRGAMPASVPLWGYYHPMLFPNWAVKFFADALLLYDRFNLTVADEQEAWVKKCIELQLDGGGWRHTSTRLEPLDVAVCRRIQNTLSTLPQDSTVLDLGCGEGRYIEELSGKLPHLKFSGIDPCAPVIDAQIRQGSAYSIPFPDSSFDAMYAFIVMQHLHDPELAFKEIRRVLKPGGLLFVGDRDLWSGRGVLKPYHEIKGRWMYPWDSPFRERWYSAGQWRRMMSKAGFEVSVCERLANPGERGWRGLVRMNSFLVLIAKKHEALV